MKQLPRRPDRETAAEAWKDATSSGSRSPLQCQEQLDIGVAEGEREWSLT